MLERKHMERWERSNTYRLGRDAANPSFSSSLLDSIYRSIDDTGEDNNVRRSRTYTSELDFSTARKHLYQTNNKSETKRISVTATEKPTNRRATSVPKQRERYVLNSASSSSESSYGGFSSSDADSRSVKPKLLSIPLPPKAKSERSGSNSNSSSIRNRFRASKIYGELKKAKFSKTPESPGGRLASFLNTLFAATPKKAKPGSAGEESACSSASSFSRSCLSKTPTSAKSSGAKRSVRFYPVHVVLGDDLPAVPPVRVREEVEVDEMEEDDVASCASSDLFELENLTAVGGVGVGERFRNELPVYETTHFHTNRAIARGLIV